MKKPHYGWLICAAGTVLIFLTMGTVSNGFSVYLPYIREEFGFTNTQTSTLVTLRCLVSFFAMLSVGLYYKKFSLRVGTGLAAACAGIAFIVYSFARTYPAFCAGAAVSGLAYGLGSMIPVSILINNWFVRHRALAVGICAAGSGIATIVLPPVTALAIESIGMQRTFRVEGIVIFALVALVVLVLRNEPTEMGLEKYGAEDAGTTAVPPPSAALAAGNGMDRRRWVLLGIACVFMGALANPGFSHLSVLFTSEGYAPMAVAALISVVGVTLTLGKILCGHAADRLGGKRATAISCGVLFVGKLLCCLAFLQRLPLCYVAGVLTGVGYSICTVGQSVWAGDLAAPSEYARVVRRLQIVYAGGALAFSSVPGLLADRLGSYIPAYMIFAAMAVGGLVCVQLAYGRRERKAAAVRR